MSEEKVAVVRDQFEAVNERDFARAMDRYADDVVLEVHAFIEQGSFSGREAVGQWFGNWFSTFEPDYRFEIEEAREVGGYVLLVAGHRGRGRASGIEVHGHTAYVYGVSGGKVRRVEIYETRDDALASIERHTARGAAG